MSQGRPFHLHDGGYNRNRMVMDTTYTKLFVGGLAWETQRDTMRLYFQQFGDIQEAVVITDKNTGRSKGYGFVTFKDSEAAMRACQNPSPVIDGRRANCNLASFGAPHNTPHGRFRAGSSLGAPSAYQSSPSTYFHQPTTPLQYSYTTAGYTQDNMYHMSYYGIYGGLQYSPYYTTGASGAAGAYYPLYAHYSQATQYPLHYLPPRYASPGILSLPPSTFTTTSSDSITIASRTQNSGVTVAAATQVIRTASGQSSSN